MKPTGLFSTGIASTLLLFACGPNSRDQGELPDADTTCIPTSQTESCSNGFDDDCDNMVDCDDTDCAGIGNCPANSDACELSTMGAAIPLPDGDGDSYYGMINFTGFPAGATLDNPADLQQICVNMEHSWARDIQIEAICPNGQTVVLSMFLGQTGGEVFLGQPNEADEGGQPIPGVGADYCFSAAATNPDILDYANNTGVHDLPADSYQPSGDMNGFMGCPLNGVWQLKVTDLWPIDNGYIFSSKFTFASTLANNCGDWE